MAKLTPAQLAEILAVFGEEARTHVEQMSANVLGLERAAGDEARKLLEGTARLAHNVKGAASSLGLDEVSKLTHALEQALRGLPEPPLPPEVGTRLLEALDGLGAALAGDASGPQRLLGALAAIGSAPAQHAAPAAPEEAAPAERRAADRDWVRVPVSLLDAMTAPLSALVVSHAGARESAEQARAAVEQLEAQARLQAGDAAGRAAARALREAAARVEQLGRATALRARQGELALDELEDALRRARLVPLGTLEPFLARTLRDAAVRAGRQAELELSGGDVGLDRRTLDALRDPLVHLVRNAVAHGIERTEQREAAGKSRSGRVRVLAMTAGQSVIVEVSDDGAGIDLAAVRARAAELGLVPPERARSLSEAEALDLVFHPGFSTAAEVNELAGRGVGLDVVRDAAHALGGHASARSEPGAGASFRVVVPLALVSTRALLVKAGGALFALPASAVERAGRLASAKRLELDGGRWIESDGAPLRVRPLVAGAEDAPLFVAVAAGGRRAALAVSEIAGELAAVVQPIGPPLNRHPGVLGAALLPSGAPVVVLSPRELASGGEPMALRAPARSRAKRRVLVVDDSITTRTLESQILRSAGFEVGVASDGREALDALRAQPFDAVVSDVEMPRLDGVELAAAIAADPALSAIPVLLVTSLADEASRRRGLAAGARAYIVKSRFDQDELLAAVRRVLP